jgi:mannosyltransferase
MPSDVCDAGIFWVQWLPEPENRNSVTAGSITGRQLPLARYRTWLLLGVVLLLAVVLRLYRIDAQSFWNDEGNSARLAERSIDLILEGAKGDIHPPGYYLALHYWRAVFGQTEAALRSLSALCSVLTVAVAFFLGRRLFDDDAAGLTAAALVAVNPFQIYYAQEARMYAMLALWALASSWALVTWWQSARESHKTAYRILVGYALLAAAGLYIHYAFPFVLIAQNLGVALWLWSDRGRGRAGHRLVYWVLAQFAALVLFLPWLPTAVRQVTSWSPPAEEYALPQTLADVWRLLNFGQTIPTEVVAGGLIAAGALVVLSLFPPVDDDEDSPGGLAYTRRWVLPALLVAIPVTLILGFGLYRPSYQKFLLVSSAPLSLLVGRGLIGGWRVASGVGVWGERAGAIGYRAVILLLAALFLFDTARSLNNLYFDQAYARADYRAIAGHIADNSRSGDAVILNAPNQWEVFTYYYPDDEHVFPLARQRPFNSAINRSELEQIVSDHDRLYAVFWGDAESDPERFIESWLEQNTYKAGETWYGDVRLAVYAVPIELVDAPSVPVGAKFVPEGTASDSAITLDGYTVPNEQLAAGEILQLGLFWHTDGPVSERYKVFVHLYDEGGTLVAQTDSEPGAALRPTNTWAPAERISDRYGVLIPGDAPGGIYTLAVGLYDVADPASRLILADGTNAGADRLDLTQITVDGR